MAQTMVCDGCNAVAAAVMVQMLGTPNVAAVCGDCAPMWLVSMAHGLTGSAETPADDLAGWLAELSAALTANTAPALVPAGVDEPIGFVLADQTPDTVPVPVPDPDGEQDTDEDIDVVGDTAQTAQADDGDGQAEQPAAAEQAAEQAQVEALSGP